MNSKAKADRNDPCPCGSGKKYKKCCLLKGDASINFKPKVSTPTEYEILNSEVIGQFNVDNDFAKVNNDSYANDCAQVNIDNYSNRTVDLIMLGLFDCAEKLCERILILFPEEIDGLKRLGEVYEGKGDLLKAKLYYEKALAFALKGYYASDELIDDLKYSIEDIGKTTPKGYKKELIEILYYTEIADSLIKWREFEIAEMLCLKIVELYPDKIEGYELLCILYRELRIPHLRLKHQRKVLELAEKNLYSEQKIEKIKKNIIELEEKVVKTAKI